MATNTTTGKPRIMVVTDLDGSVLDFNTYSWQAALPAIRLLKRRHIPLVFCTSKTRAEVVQLQQHMGLTDPFISETGGAIWFHPAHTPTKPTGAGKLAGLYAIVLGLPYRTLRGALIEYRTTAKLEIIGFGDLPAEQVGKLCAVPAQVAPLVKQRDFDEPFIFAQPPTTKTIDDMRRHFSRRGMRIIQGGRFYHLVGDTDKGTAIHRLRQWYEKQTGARVTIIGLGDSPNDISLFAAADIPILVKRHDGRYDPRVRAAIKTRLAGAVGPAGWNRAVLHVLKKFD
jgi:mannosyl-3-phosphoglycerate phosphatase